MDESHITTLILQRIDDVAKGVDRVDQKLNDSEKSASESRRDMHRKQEEQGRELLKIGHRLEVVEKAVSDAGPTLEDYARQRALVESAGRIGRALWWIGGLLLACVAAFIAQRDNIAQWLFGR